MLRLTLLVVAVAAAPEDPQLTFETVGGKTCSIDYDGSALSTNCKVGNGFADPDTTSQLAALQDWKNTALESRFSAMETRITSLENIWKHAISQKDMNDLDITHTSAVHHLGIPTYEPTPSPTSTPTATPTATPTSTPTDTPTAEPTMASYSPTAAPTHSGGFGSCVSQQASGLGRARAGCGSCRAHDYPPYARVRYTARGHRTNYGRTCQQYGFYTTPSMLQSCHRKYDCAAFPCSGEGQVCLTTESDSACSPTQPLCLMPTKANWLTQAITSDKAASWKCGEKKAWDMWKTNGMKNKYSSSNWDRTDIVWWPDYVYGCSDDHKSRGLCQDTGDFIDAKDIDEKTPRLEATFWTGVEQGWDKVEFEVEVFQATENGEGSFFYALDNGPNYLPTPVTVPATSQWTWVKLPTTFDVHSGEHTLKVLARKAGTRIRNIRTASDLCIVQDYWSR